MHTEIEARLNAGSFEDAQRLLAQLGVGREHTHASTYFATRILYQRGKLDLSGVIARLGELLQSCPDFPEARAMLSAAQRGSLRPDPSSFNQATVPPPPAASDDGDDDGDRLTEPGNAPSSMPAVELRLKTPQAPGIPRAPLVPRFTPRENVAPSYAPAPDLELTPPGLDLDLTPPLPPSSGSKPWNDTLSAPPPSSTRNERLHSPPPVAIDLGPLDGMVRSWLGDRNTAPSPGAPGLPDEPPTVFVIATWLSDRDFERALGAIEQLGAESSPELSLLEVRALMGLGRKAAARRSLDRLCRAPLLDPDLRAAVARLLIELHDVDRAETQARRAHSEDPESELSRLTLAWAVARSDAWLPSPRAATELSELLTDFVPEACPLPALGYALSALVLLQTSAAAARQAADAALALDGDAPDTLAVAAIIAQKQKRSSDAKRFYQRLVDVDNHAADELAATLAGLGLPVGRHAPRPASSASAPPPAPAAGAPPASAAGPPTTPAPGPGGSPWDEKSSGSR